MTEDNPFKKPPPAFRPLNIHILTVTDTRSAKEDGSGNYLAQAVQDGEHIVHSRDLVPKPNASKYSAPVPAEPLESANSEALYTSPHGSQPHSAPTPKHAA